MQGILLRLAAVALMTAMLSVIHHAAKTLPVGQIMVWRSAIAGVVILGFAWRFGGLRQVIPRKPRDHAVRGLLGALTMVFSFTSLAYLPVANASALSYLAPLITMPLAVVFLGERMGPILILAGLTGVLGMGLMLWSELHSPSLSEGGLIGIAAGLGFAVTWAFVRIHVKRMTSNESSASIAFSFAVFSTALGLLSLPFGWEPVGVEMMLYLIAAGILGAFAHILSAEAIKRAPVSTLAPFDYFGLIFALAADLVFFGIVPTRLALLGMLVIVMAGLLVGVYEARQKRKAQTVS